jgi:hypothetical protein
MPAVRVGVVGKVQLFDHRAVRVPKPRAEGLACL